MFRLVVIEVLLFLLPFAVYFAGVMLRRRLAETVPDEVAAPMMRLGVVGLVLVCVSLVGLALFGERSTGGDYVPVRFENGRLVPGYIK